MSMGKNFFDQYSVFCVFGSVVGCVVVPLIAQSVECVIFSALVISLTAATHLNKKANNDNSTKVNSCHRDNEKRRGKDTNAHGNSRRKKERHQPYSPSSVHRPVQVSVEEQFQQLVSEVELKNEQDERLNQKKARKAKKREERLQRKEQKGRSVSDQPCDSRREKAESDVKGASSRHHNNHTIKTSAISSTRDHPDRDRGSRRLYTRPPRLSHTLRCSTSDVNNNTTPNSRHSSSHRKPSSPVSLPCSNGLSMTRPSLSASNSSLSSIGSSSIDHHEATTPMSVWKLPPQNAKPMWLPPGIAHDPTPKQQETVVKRRKDESAEDKGRGDGCHNDSGFSSLFCTASRDKESITSELETVNEYSLFGPTRLNAVLSQTPSLLIK